MPLDPARARQRLKGFDLKNLFVEDLGWEHHTATHDIIVDSRSYRLGAVAHKRGFAVFICEPGADGRIPDYATRRKIDRQVTKLVHEHLIVFVDAGKTTQTWQWLKKEPGKPTACRERAYYRGQSGETIIQPLQLLAFSIEEEADLALPEVTIRVRAALDVEKVTKRFYDRFKAEHAAFLKFLKGIPDEEMQRWYVSVMLNRLMFIYFIQKKGFLDSNPSYLRVKLAESKERGKDRFYGDFLCPLFFEGFAKKEGERSAATNKLLGKVPYLNGGLFLRHQIEERYGNAIQIGDGAFEKLFVFFEQYTWHLDERPLKKDDEINPDVLGYIFEKYVNQKQMGAYYSKEDITGYISQNTVIPFLCDQARKECKIAFEGPHSIWRLLQADPDRYIYDAVKRGVHLKLPPEIAAGLKDVAKRNEWNKPAPEEYALPTEIWREVVARRQRYEEVRGKLVAGEIGSINDLITYNLDIRQFAQDVIETSEGPELLRAFYKAIKSVSVLDPACGSGAFLFAALNILESLYEACLDRMQVFLDELERSGQKRRPEKFADFRKELERVAAHPNRKYFIYKTIIVNNLFGVDIMEEATEICKLRLFLKLVAQIERLDQIEPLPDIDFNIRAGNSLIGYTNLDQVRKAIPGNLFVEEEMKKILKGITEQAEDAERLFALFRRMQTDDSADSREFTTAKNRLRERLGKLEEQLSGFLAGEFGVDSSKKPSYQAWRDSHKPFHWFIDFFKIMTDGGFDIVIGNPPYVEKRVIEGQYNLRGYATAATNNLYAYFIERAGHIQHNASRFGFIVPLSSMATDKFAPLQNVVLNRGTVWLSNYDDRPSRLFDGLEHIQLTIILYEMEPAACSGKVFATRCAKWASIERPNLFKTLRYVALRRGYLENSVPKVGSAVEANILDKLWGMPRPLGSYCVESGDFTLYYTRKVHAFLNVLDFIPEIRDGSGKKRAPSEQKELSFSTKRKADSAFSVLNSSLFRWFITSFSDCRNLNRREVLGFPIDLDAISENHGKALSSLAARLASRLQETSEVRVMRFGDDTLRVQCIIPKHSKDIIDEIDRVLAQHYDFTDEELDFIVNYEIKYRVGEDSEGTED